MDREEIKDNKNVPHPSLKKKKKLKNYPQTQIQLPSLDIERIVECLLLYLLNCKGISTRRVADLPASERLDMEF